MENYQVIFHIVDIEKWSAVLNNVSNLLKDQQDTDNQLEIEVLVNGASVRYLDSTNDSTIDEEELTRLNEQGVKFVACNNSLTANKITQDSLFPMVSVVSAGVSELVRKQLDGYAYIKP